MNAPTVIKPGIDAFHRERSRCVDAFASCEEVVSALMLQVGAKSTADLFGQKIANLAKVAAHPQYAKARREKVNALLDALVELLPLRNDIVHGRLRLAEIDAETFACFVNSREIGVYPVARILPLDNLRALTRTVAKIAEDLRAA